MIIAMLLVKKSPSSSSLVCGSSKIACVNHLLQHRLLQNEKEHPIIKVRIGGGDLMMPMLLIG